MKTADDFKKAAKEIKPMKWNIRSCSMCDYPCGYVFVEQYEIVGYDSGCDCTRRYIVNRSSYDDIAIHYNRQKNPEYLKEMNKFWGFDRE